MGIIAATDPLVGLEGQWDTRAGIATTVNSGSRISLAVRPGRLALLFDPAKVPAQVWVRVDDAPPSLHTVDAGRLELSARGTVEVAVKDVDEHANRWTPPLHAALVLRGIEAANGLLAPPRPAGPSMVCYGDSITQGVRALGMALGPDGSDGTRSFAYLTARAFDADARQIGFGRQGITRPGNGGVPPAADALGATFHGSPAPVGADLVVVNHGANDQVDLRAPYAGYLRRIRAHAPGGWIFAVAPFGGAHADAIRQAVDDLADERIRYVDTRGWLSARDFTDGTHPNIGGHRRAADRLVEVIAAATGD